MQPNPVTSVTSTHAGRSRGTMTSARPRQRNTQLTKWLKSSHHTHRVVQVEAVAGHVDEERHPDQPERQVRRPVRPALASLHQPPHRRHEQHHHGVGDQAGAEGLVGEAVDPRHVLGHGELGDREDQHEGREPDRAEEAATGREIGSAIFQLCHEADSSGREPSLAWNCDHLLARGARRRAPHRHSLRPRPRRGRVPDEARPGRAAAHGPPPGRAGPLGRRRRPRVRRGVRRGRAGAVDLGGPARHLPGEPRRAGAVRRGVPRRLRRSRRTVPTPSAARGS